MAGVVSVNAKSRPEHRCSCSMPGIKHSIAFPNVLKIHAVSGPIARASDTRRIEESAVLEPSCFHDTESLASALNGVVAIEDLRISILVHIVQPRIGVDKLVKSAMSQIEHL